MPIFEIVKFKMLTLALAACVPVAAALSGASLATYVADRFRPPVSVPEATPAASWWTGATSRMGVIPAEWWYSDAVHDAYNELLAPAALITARGSYIPAELVSVTSRGEGWSAGIALIGDTEINAWMPDEDRLGDLARRIMYLATVYPQRLWRSHGAMILEDGGWPLLRPFGKELLLGWHRSDPVDEREREENKKQGARQGNVNPFVEYPQLAEYLWGERAGEDFEVPSEPIVPPDPPGPSEPTVTPIPLKASYSIAEDRFLWFKSPYVPSDASWSIDGMTVDSDKINLSDIGRGVHELTFSSGAGCGAIKIEIRP